MKHRSDADGLKQCIMENSLLVDKEKRLNIDLDVSERNSLKMGVCVRDFIDKLYMSDHRLLLVK